MSFRAEARNPSQQCRISNDKYQIKRMNMSEPRSGDRVQKRQSFKDASESEQIERFVRLRKIFDDDSQFRSFWRRVESYSDRFSIPGQSIDQKRSTFAKAKRAVEKIDAVLELLKQLKLEKSGKDDKEAIALELDELRRLSDSDDIVLDDDNLSKAFRWALESFIKGAEKIGRTADINQSEVNDLTEDVRSIIAQVKERIEKARAR